MKLQVTTFGCLGILLLFTPSVPAYPPPPSGTSSPSPNQTWESKMAASFDEALALYQAGIVAYVDGDPDLASSSFLSALDLLEAGLREPGGSLDDDWDLLRRKALYLLNKVSRNGEYEILPADGAWDLGPPPESADQLPEIPIVDNENTHRWEKYFSENAHDRFATYLTRSGKYESVMRKILREYGLPEDLVYLPLIESGFNPRAYSVAHASGCWQFISSTGKRCGLRVDYWVDERRDPEKSCGAAARHLRHLWEIFESWPLALAAYNAGEKRVMDAILAGGTRDFWKLRLPRQTRDYVPRYMAAVKIAKDPKAYGFDVSYAPPLDYEILEVDQATDLETIARCSGSPEATLKDLNPHLRRGCTPPAEPDFPVMIPIGTLEPCKKQLFDIPKDRRLAKASQFTEHRVRRGETLSHIAVRYGTTVSDIVAANNLRSRHLIREGQKLTIPTLGGYSGSSGHSGDVSNEDGEKIVHVVKRGDTLQAIARAYNTRVDNLRRWNGLGRNAHIIHPGDRLLIFLEKRS